MSKKLITNPRIVIADDYVAKLHLFDSVVAASIVAHAEHPEIFKNSEAARNAIRSGRERALKRAKQGEGTNAVVPEGFALKGTTTLYKAGEEVLQWVKTDEDKLKQAAIIRESLEALADSLPRAKPAKAPSSSGNVSDNLCNLYTITRSPSLLWVSGSKRRSDSNSSPKSSARTGEGREGGKKSRMPPRREYSPGTSTCSARW